MGTLKMNRTLVALVFGTTALAAGPAFTADFRKDASPPILVKRAQQQATYGRCQPMLKCGAYDCRLQRVCYRCPDYTCFAGNGFPLFGAYGPYGGANYWGAYTGSGWGRD